MSRQECLAVTRAVQGRGTDPVGHYPFTSPIERKRLARKPPLLLAGEQDRTRISEYPILGPRPIEGLLEMLERIGVPKPRIEHAMRENVIGNAAARQCSPGPEAVVLPEAVDDHGVVLRDMRLQPRHEPGIISIAPAGWTERMHRPRKIGDGLIRRIQRNDLAAMSFGEQLPPQLHDAGDRTTAARIHARYHVTDQHGSRPPLESGSLFCHIPFTECPACTGHRDQIYEHPLREPTRDRTQ